MLMWDTAEEMHQCADERTFWRQGNRGQVSFDEAFGVWLWSSSTSSLTRDAWPR